MLIQVRAREAVLLGAMERHLEKRVRAALGRSATRVASVTLALVDVNGPRGGEDLRCSVTVELVPRGSLRAEATSSDISSAVGRALARVRRGLRGGAKPERRAAGARRSARSVGPDASQWVANRDWTT
jgi:ribosome-associated translation inhibitor RaiA